MIRSLLTALQCHRVAKMLRCGESRRTVDRQLPSILAGLDEEKSPTTLFLPLVRAVLRRASDVEIWKLVLLVVTSESPSLLRMPRELRDVIYDYATCESEAPITSQSRRKRNLGVLQTCRQMRKEAYEQYYQNTTFRGVCSDCVEWLCALDTLTRSLLRRILITFALGPKGQLSFTTLQTQIADVRSIPALSPECAIEAHFVSLPY